MTADDSMPAPAPANVGPQPCPQGFLVQVAQSPTGSAVVLTFIGPCGQWVVFLDLPQAKEFIRQVNDAVMQASTGLVVSRQMPPPASNGHGPTIQQRP